MLKQFNIQTQKIYIYISRYTLYPSQKITYLNAKQNDKILEDKIVQNLHEFSGGEDFRCNTRGMTLERHKRNSE